MATEIETTATTTAPPSGVVPYRLTVDQFMKMIDAGVFPDHARVELLGGRLVTRMTKSNPHNFSVTMVAELLRGMLGPGHSVREEKSVELDRWSRPEPDVAVARGPTPTYRGRGVMAGDLLMIAEVADSTYAKDRGEMWRRYAEAGVPVYWIVNIRARRVEVYSVPEGRGKTAAYREAAVFAEADEVPVVVDGNEVGAIAVKDILP